jgi:hypothetical protein
VSEEESHQNRRRTTGSTPVKIKESLAVGYWVLGVGYSVLYMWVFKIGILEGVCWLLGSG